METDHTDENILQEMIDISYGEISDNAEKTKIRKALAAKYGREEVYIKDVIWNGYNKSGRRLDEAVILKLLKTNAESCRIDKIKKDPFEGYIYFNDSSTKIHFVTTAPDQIGIAINKILSNQDDAFRGFIIITNGNNGALDKRVFERHKRTLEKLDIIAASVHSGGIDVYPSGVTITKNEPKKVDLKNLHGEFSNSLNCSGLIVNNHNTTMRLASSLLAKRFLILTGTSGSGKTKLAQAFARWIGPKLKIIDPFFPGSEIKSDGLSYFVVSANDDRVDLCDSKEADKVDASLERRMINEWAGFILERDFSQTTPSKEILKDFLNSGRHESRCEFDSHLKAAAFALIEAEKSDAKSKNYELVPVGADWTGNENILGYPHGLEAGKYVTKQALDLIHRAYDHADIPHFLILDEMNLSHVERYFADLLSAIESDEPLRLHHDAKLVAGNGRNVEAKITLPQNLFIIGTVNVDETTYMFSPKVLDRANVIEFRMDESEIFSFLESPEKPELKNLGGLGAHFGESFVGASRSDALVPEDVKTAYGAEMLLFFKVLQAYGCEYGYRVAHEAARFMHFYHSLGQGKIWDRSADEGKGSWVDKTADGRTWFHDAFDALVVQKFLPKLNGSEANLRKPLWALAHLSNVKRDWNSLIAESLPLKKAVDVQFKQIIGRASSTSDADSPDELSKTATAVVYPVSFDKVVRMWRSAKTNGFTSFAESV